MKNIFYCFKYIAEIIQYETGVKLQLLNDIKENS